MSLTAGTKGVLHGAYTYIIQNDEGQIEVSHSISAGLDYPGVGPEHAYLKDSQRVEYVGITDSEALEALQILCRTEGIIPALESSHALAQVMKISKKLQANDIVIVCLSGSGEKDLDIIKEYIDI